MILVDALYIHRSGGRVLLDFLIKKIEEKGYSVFYLLDERIRPHYDYIPLEKKIYLKAGILSRYIFYFKNRRKFNRVFCFGNIPPPIRLNSEVYVYFQNVLYFENKYNENVFDNFLFRLKKLYIKLTKRNSNFWIVQTESVKNLLSLKLKVDINSIKVIPFFDLTHIKYKKRSSYKVFIYISDGYPHKNHLTLLRAWEILFSMNIIPELHLTVSNNYPKLIGEIEKLKLKGLKIVNHGYVEINQLLYKSDILIYPSLFESFGLGLVEAVGAGLKVISSNLPYVKEVIIPSDVFDPNNPIDIAEKVKNCMSNERVLQHPKIKIKNDIQKLISMLFK